MRTMISSFHFPSRGINKFQGIVHAIGITVEILRVVGALHVGIHREERRHHGVIASAVHVNQAESHHVFVARVASVEHRLFKGGVVPVAKPSVGVTKVAPSVVAQLLLNSAVAVGYGGPICFTPYHNMVDLWAKIMNSMLLRKCLVFIRCRWIANLPKRMCLVLHKLPATDDLVSRSNFIDIQSHNKIHQHPYQRNPIQRCPHTNLRCQRR